jgi:hypothetical protein
MAKQPHHVRCLACEAVLKVLEASQNTFQERHAHLWGIRDSSRQTVKASKKSRQASATSGAVQAASISARLPDYKGVHNFASWRDFDGVKEA